MSETAISKAVRQALVLLGCHVTRHQCGSLHGGRVNLGDPGWPDTIGLTPDGRFLGVETKTPVGRARPAQLEWMARAAKAGAVCGFVRSAQEAVELVMRARGTTK